LDKSKQYEVVGIYTEISYGPGIQPTYEFRIYSNEIENRVYRLEYFCLDLTLSENENMVKLEEDCISESMSGNEEIQKQYPKIFKLLNYIMKDDLRSL
jgi:hypothetical protein